MSGHAMDVLADDGLDAAFIVLTTSGVTGGILLQFIILDNVIVAMLIVFIFFVFVEFYAKVN